MKRKLKRRSAIVATIGHMNTEGRLARRHLLGQAVDALSALLAAAGHSLRLILSSIAHFFSINPGRSLRAIRIKRYFPET
ncbi:hypothetical protein JCM17960_08650 [Magnetospira thiophila]